MRLRSFAWLLATCMVLSPVSFGEVASKEDVKKLEQKLAELEKTIAELRAAEGTTAQQATVAELERKIEVLAQEIENLKLGEAASEAGESVHGLGPAASKVYGVHRGVSIGGYGEMLYENFDSERQDGTPSGAEDRLDYLRAVFYFGYKFDDRILFNSELEVEHATTGEGGEERGEVALEFAYLDFLVKPAFNVRAGMMLIPVGFINELHEPPVYLGSRRPEVERRLIPSTWRENGAGFFGDAGPVTYRAYVVTGLASVAGSSSDAEGFGPGGIRDGRSSGFKASTRDLALTGRVDVRPVGGLTLGTGFHIGETGQGVRAPSTGEVIGGRTILMEGHVEYRWRGLWLRGLYVRTTVDDVEAINDAQGLTGDDSVGSRQVGWYAEAGYDVLHGVGSGRQSLIPFLRYERLDTQHRVPDGFSSNPANAGSIGTLGLVWKPIPQIAVKADWNRVRNDATSGIDQINASLGFLF